MPLPSLAAARSSATSDRGNARWEISSSALKLEQPSVSKHLKVLRDVGLVRVRRSGRHMLYRTNADAIRPLHEWSKMFEPYWQHQLSRIKEHAEAKAGALKNSIKEEKEK